MLRVWVCKDGSGVCGGRVPCVTAYVDGYVCKCEDV